LTPKICEYGAYKICTFLIIYTLFISSSESRKQTEIESIEKDGTLNLFFIELAFDMYVMFALSA